MTEQLELYDENLRSKVHRLEKWIGRLNKELWMVKMSIEIRQKLPEKMRGKKDVQLDFVG